MLLPLRWLFYQATTTEEREAFTSKNRAIQRELRKLRRLAQWTEAVAPPRIPVEVDGEATRFWLYPVVRPGAVVTTKHVMVYSKGLMLAAPSVNGFLGIDVSVIASEIAIKSAVLPGEIETKIDLLEEEMVLLMNLLS